MQRQSMKTNSVCKNGSIYNSHMTTNTTATKQSFPEVVSYLTNPFHKRNLNYSVKNQQAIITPKMASGMRFDRGFKQKGRVHKSLKS